MYYLILTLKVLIKMFGIWLPCAGVFFLILIGLTAIIGSKTWLKDLLIDGKINKKEKLI